MATYSLPDLPYDYSALEPHLSGQILEFHHDKHHATYVKGANDTLDQIAEASASGGLTTVNSLSKNLAFHVSGHVLHNIYWNNLSPDGGGRPEGELLAAITETFGDFEKYQAYHSAVVNQHQGSGWGILSWEPLGGRIVVEGVHDHETWHCQSTAPLLAIDAWEHAFYLQYQNKKPDYTKAIWNLINWADVTARFEKARAGSLSFA